MPSLVKPYDLTLLQSSMVDDYVTALAWSPDGSRLAVADASGAVTLLDGSSGTQRLRLPGHALGTLALAWSPDGSLLATGGQDGKARIWSKASETALAEVAGGAAWVEHVAWSPDGALLASGSGKHLKLWNPDGTAHRSGRALPASIAALAWHRGALAGACYGGVHLWPAGPEGEGRLLERTGSLIAMAWSPDGTHIACGCQDAAVHVWTLPTEKDLTMQGYPMKVRALTWSADSHLLATCAGADGVVWDFGGKGPTGSKPRLLSGHASLIEAMAFQREGSLLATGDQAGEVMVWNPRKRSPLIARGRGDQPVSALAWRPDDQLLAVGYADGKVLFWSA